MDIDDLRREIRELRQRLDDFPTTTNKEVFLPKVTIQKDPPSKTKQLKPTKFPMYNGDRSTYPAWRRAILTILRMDWNTLGYTYSRAFLMIYKALEGKAQKRAAAFFESGGPGELEDPEEFILFLDRGNWDQTRVSRAKSELNEMKMGQRQNWNPFYHQWANKLTEAKGELWPDDVKISLLQGAINKSLKAPLACNHLIPEDDFPEYVRIVSKIALQQEQVTSTQHEQLIPDARSIKRDKLASSLASSESANVNREWSRSGNEYGYARSFDTSGDTIMGGVNSAKVIRGSNGKPMRAKWKSPEQIERLKKERKCYRCERKGCSTKTCGLLPAIKPAGNKMAVNSLNLGPIDPNVCEEDSGSDSSSSEVVSEN